MLSSWMIRLAHANGHKVQPFYRFWLGAVAQPLWARDVDRFASQDLLEEMARRTGVALIDLEQATLRSFEANVFHFYSERGQMSWLMPLGIFHRDRRRAGLMCCPACLNDDREPFFRKAWRLSVSVACVRHACLLVEQCSKCQATIQPHRADHKNRSWLTQGVTLAHCWNCDADLRNEASEPANPSLLAAQRRLLDAVDNGHVEVAGRPGLHSILYFRGLRMLVSAILRMKEVGGLTFSSRQLFETFDVRRRGVLLEEADRLQEDWPSRFREKFSKMPRAYPGMVRSTPERPYWIDQEVELLDRSRLPLTQGEIDAIARVVTARKEPLRGKHVLREFGRDLSRHIASTRVGASDDYANAVLDALDYRISMAHGVDRLDLIRDRTMLLCARILRLSQRRIADLALEDVEASHDHDVPLDDVPADAASLQSYLRRFVRLDRHRYDAGANCTWLFPCRSRTGKMSPSLVNARYINALRLARMSGPTLPYREWIC